jgi:hypothetical protein
VISCLVGGRRVSNLLVRPGKQETKKRKRLMSRNTSQKRGLALGAIVALIGSFFVSAPAQAAATDGSNIAIRPVNGTALVGMVYNEFDLYAQLLPGQSNASFNSSLKWRINVTSGFKMNLAYSSSITASPALDQDYTASSTSYPVISGADTATSVSFAAYTNSGAVNYLTIKAHSTSAEAGWSAVTMTVTAWIDDITIGNGVTSGTGVIDADEWRTTATVTLHNMSTLPVTRNWTAPKSRDTYVTASATITTLNFENLGNGKFFLVSTASRDIFGATGGSTAASSSTLAGSTLQTRNGVISTSWQISPISDSESVSFTVRYDKFGVGNLHTTGFGTTMTAYAATVQTVDDISISATATADIAGGSISYQVRPNKTYTFVVTAASGSSSVAGTVTVVLSGTGLVTSSKTISINGGASLTGYPVGGFSVTTGANGRGSFTLATSGFVDGEYIDIDAEVGAEDAATVRLNVKNPTYTVVADNALVATTPGTAVNLGFTVEDQWGELSTATNHFLKVTRGGDKFRYATTVSYHAVTAGVATVAFTPEPATMTGSATVEADIVKWENGAYIDVGTDADVTITVTSTTNAFASGLAASRAASVSYFPSTVSWKTVTGYVTVSGSIVKVTGDSTLVFRGATATTYSGEVTVYADSTGLYSFEVAALRSGNKTMTLTNGTATTTSLLVVAEAGSDMGRSISWDTSTIESGKTRVITGTLVDANGNPVDTTGAGRTAGDSGTASIVVTYTGTAGILVGTMPTETDADGKFKVSVLTAAADSGTLTITAVYMPQGASTVTGNKITSVQAVTVAPAAAPEVNAVIGSFNGRWAVRVENAKGSVVSVKAGSRWVKFTSLNNNYLFSRKSVVGRTLAVSVWVDGELQNSQTITIK